MRMRICSANGCGAVLGPINGPRAVLPARVTSANHLMGVRITRIGTVFLRRVDILKCKRALL